MTGYGAQDVDAGVGPAQCRLVVVSCPQADAEGLAEGLVRAKQAACVNILPGMRSVYWWQGEVETASESLLLIKTTAAAYPALEQAVCRLHPYELPEILAFAPEQGLEGYLEWVRACVGSE